MLEPRSHSRRQQVAKLASSHSTLSLLQRRILGADKLLLWIQTSLAALLVIGLSVALFLALSVISWRAILIGQKEHVRPSPTQHLSCERASARP